MADTIITIPNDPPPENSQPSQLEVNLAILSGQLLESSRQTQEKLNQFESNQSTLSQTIQSQSEIINRLLSQQGTTSRQVEMLNESQTDIISTMEDSESEESDVIQVTPPMETKIEIEQKPVSKKSIWAKFLYG